MQLNTHLNINTSPKNDSFDFTPSFDGYADSI